MRRSVAISPPLAHIRSKGNASKPKENNMKITSFVWPWVSMTALYSVFVVSTQAQAGICNPQYVTGQWSGLVGGAPAFSAGFSVDFAFRQDGTYTYNLGVGDLEWFTLSGAFTIQQNPDHRPNPYGIVQYDPCIITLTPDSRAVEHKTGDLRRLASLGILSDQQRIFFVWKGQQAGLKLVFTQFPKPPNNHMRMMSLWPAQ
jgi:hypothetical protein